MKLVSKCCHSEFDPFGPTDAVGLPQPVCDKCQKICELDVTELPKDDKVIGTPKDIKMDTINDMLSLFEAHTALYHTQEVVFKFVSPSGNEVIATLRHPVNIKRSAEGSGSVV